MSKQIRNIIIAVAVVLLLAGVLLLLNLLPAQPPEDDDTTTTSAVEMSTVEGMTTAAANAGIYLTQDEEGNLDAIEVENETGSYKISQPQKNMWVVDGYEDLLTSDSVGFLVDSCANFKVASVANENCTNFAEYGLDDPAASVHIAFRDGSEMTVYFGDIDPSSPAKSRYLYVKGGKTVYLESVGLYSAFSQSLEEMFSAEMLSPQRSTDGDGNTVYAEVDSMELSGAAREQVIKIEANKDYEKQTTGNRVLTDSKLIITAPITAPLDISKDSGQFGSAYSRILETGITASSVAKVHPTEIDLAKYGLTEPAYTLKFTSGKNEYIFHMSKFDYKESVYYAMDEFGKVVFRINETGGKWMTATLDQLAPKKLYDGDCFQLSKVTVKTETGTNTFNVTQLGNFQMTVKNGSKEVDVGLFRNFFDTVCSLEWVDAAQTIPTIGGRDTVLEIRIEYTGDTHFSSAAGDVITLTKSSARRYMIGINGRGYFACDSNALNALLTAYKALL